MPANHGGSAEEGRPQLDRPLSVERLTPADLVAAGQAVAAIVLARYGDAPGDGPAFSLRVHWLEAAAGETWSVLLTDVAVRLDLGQAWAEAERLLQPMLQAMRPRAAKHVFRSRMDEATLEDIAAIAEAGMPTPDTFEPRWVVDRTVLHVSPPSGAARLSPEQTEAALADIRNRLGTTIR